MIYHFDSLEALAIYLELKAKEARERAAKSTKKLTIAKLQSEAYGFEQSAHVVRSSVITETK